MTDTDREDLIDMVLKAIQKDMFSYDFTALEILLHNVADEHLLAFLPEHDNVPF